MLSAAFCLLALSVAVSADGSVAFEKQTAIGTRGLKGMRRILTDASHVTDIYIFLHGYPVTGDIWNRTFMHLEQTVPEANLYAPDMRGYGTSVHPTADGAYSSDEILDDIRDLAKTACTGCPAGTPVHLVASDLAGTIAYLYVERSAAGPAEEWPHVRSLTTINAPHPNQLSRALYDGFLATKDGNEPQLPVQAEALRNLSCHIANGTRQWPYWNTESTLSNKTWYGSLRSAFQSSWTTATPRTPNRWFYDNQNVSGQLCNLSAFIINPNSTVVYPCRVTKLGVIWGNSDQDFPPFPFDFPSDGCKIKTYRYTGLNDLDRFDVLYHDDGAFLASSIQKTIHFEYPKFEGLDKDTRMWLTVFIVIGSTAFTVIMIGFAAILEFLGFPKTTRVPPEN
eukprot:NODE_1303_length_1482_cov_27.628053_g1083_i0.p1 GENE.NODE_1303_length_1482_cov_27.628053_g1083_i0~~NODE_1303_length_1482_cov_27.628053_g1083_i0.p1  ORF type:complete len:395 (-),score=78.40 NODE_1303_length_1482_cov_27.628053_g1083_i0:117-1301(-)